VDYFHYLKSVVVQIVESAEFRDVLIDFAESVQSYLDQEFDSTNYGEETFTFVSGCVVPGVLPLFV